MPADLVTCSRQTPGVHYPTANQALLHGSQGYQRLRQTQTFLDSLWHSLEGKEFQNKLYVSLRINNPFKNVGEEEQADSYIRVSNDSPGTSRVGIEWSVDRSFLPEKSGIKSCCPVV